MASHLKIMSLHRASGMEIFLEYHLNSLNYSLVILKKLFNMYRYFHNSSLKSVRHSTNQGCWYVNFIQRSAWLAWCTNFMKEIFKNYEFRGRHFLEFNLKYLIPWRKFRECKSKFFSLKPLTHVGQPNNPDGNKT